MANLTTHYLGLTLKNPIIAGSSGLMKSIDNLKEAETAGAGAVVLKSIFEEQIMAEIKQELDVSNLEMHPEAMDYIRRSTRENSIDAHLRLIESAKSSLSIPVIASINCMRAGEWTEFGRRIENAGADALELNVLVTDYDRFEPREIESKYLELLISIKNQVSIPIAMKISSQFTNLPHIIQTLSGNNVDGLVMFNRYWNPDIDIEGQVIVPASSFSSSKELYTPLRWIAMISNRITCDICGSTGVHDSNAAIKLIMAGAQTVQVCSILYQKGISYLSTLIQGVHKWLDDHEYSHIHQIRKIMGQKSQKELDKWGRVQFMKYYSELE
ncbi:dihydroorotate dehydrogenase-like protein [bacterium]|nr:dihydroorotate dehydrogenase-like protein [bacterium]